MPASAPRAVIECDLTMVTARASPQEAARHPGRSTIVSGRYNAVLPDDDRAYLTARTVGPSRYGLGYRQEVFIPVWPLAHPDTSRKVGS